MPNQSISQEKLISDEAKSFLNKYISSVVHLDILLLLYNRSHQDFGIKMLVEQFSLKADLISEVLSDLVNKRTVSRRGDKIVSYWYSPGEDRNIILDELNTLYSKKRSEVISLILNK